MVMRLLGWLRRKPAHPGRHIRAMPSSVMTGAAVTIVGSAALDPRVTGVTGVTGLTTPVAPVALVATEAEPRPDDVPWPAVAPADDQPAPLASAVTLGFADGASVVLDPDDPRLERFRAAAEAVLETPQV